MLVQVQAHILADAHMRTCTLHCEALQCIDDAAAELALLRVSTNVCRVAHIFRGAGSDVPSADLDAVDEVVDATLSVTLGGPVRGLALERDL